MKNIKKIHIPILIALVFSIFSCTEDEIGTSLITNYPVFELNGEDVIFINKGDEYSDPGVVVTENGVEIEYSTSISSDFRNFSELDTNKPDIYRITYSAVNKDGFAGTASRTVIVTEQGNLIDNISGLYTSTVLRNGAGGAAYTDMEYVMIWKRDDGKYEMSDGIGLYYAVGRAYGNSYLARPVIITANDISSNDFSIPPFTVGTFGGVAEMTGLTADSVNKEVNYSTDWDAGYTFAVTLTQVEF